MCFQHRVLNSSLWFIDLGGLEPHYPRRHQSRLALQISRTLQPFLFSRSFLSRFEAAAKQSIWTQVMYTLTDHVSLGYTAWVAQRLTLGSLWGLCSYAVTLP